MLAYGPLNKSGVMKEGKLGDLEQQGEKDRAEKGLHQKKAVRRNLTRADGRETPQCGLLFGPGLGDLDPSAQKIENPVGGGLDREGLKTGRCGPGRDPHHLDLFGQREGD